MSDPCLFNSPHGSVLLLGKSATGKTTLVHRILKKYIKLQTRIFTVNVKNNEYQKLSSSIKNVSFDKLDRIPKSSIVVIEDVIHLSPANAIFLRELINYRAHHDSLKVFIIAHHLLKTNVYQLIPYFHYIVFTCHQANVPIIRILFHSFRLEKSLIQNWLEHYISFVKSTPFSYFFFDTARQTYNFSVSLQSLIQNQFSSYSSNDSEVVRSNDSTHLQKISNFQDRFNFFLFNHPLQNQAKAVFSILLHCVPLNQINNSDLTLSVYSKTKRSYLHFSLIDYVICLLSPDCPVRTSDLFLHNYFKHHCQIPTIFIHNKRFKKP